MVGNHPHRAALKAPRNLRRPAIFLDRDGVLNEAIVREGRPYPPRNAEEFRLRPEAAAALAAFKQAGYVLVVVTNQPDVGRGELLQETVEAMHARLLRELPIDAIEVSYDTDDAAPRRKPNPGMLLDAAARLNLDLGRSFLIGDRWRDVEAARRAGCPAIFLDHGYEEAWPVAAAERRVGSLLEAVAQILEQSQPALAQLRVKLYADGADRERMMRYRQLPYVTGFTTNPSLMKQAGVQDYAAACRELAAQIPDRSLSLEVIADDFAEMERQARLIAPWGENVFVKIPITNSRGESSLPLIRRLAEEGTRLNVTALTTLKQVSEVAAALRGGPAAIVSVFAGRIADTGRDPMPLMAAAAEILAPHENQQLLWASSREVFNVFQAEQTGCDIITVAHDLLDKLGKVGKDLTQYSLETVQLFVSDAAKAGFNL